MSVVQRVVSEVQGDKRMDRLGRDHIVVSVGGEIAVRFKLDEMEDA